MIDDLMTAIQSVLSGVSGVVFYYDEAPKGERKLYCVWFLMPSVFSYDTGKSYVTVYPQLDFYSAQKNSNDLSNIIKAVGRMEVKFIKSALSVTGYSTMKCKEISRTEPRKEGERWRIIVEYEIMLAEN